MKSIPNQLYFERRMAGKTVNEITCEDVLPDYFPDIRKIVRIECRPTLAGRRISEREIDCAGNADFYCFYLSAENTPHVRTVHTTFDLSVPAQDLDENCVITLIPHTEGLSWRLSGPRKLILRCRITTQAAASSPADAAADETDADACGELEYTGVRQTPSYLYSGEDDERRFAEDCVIPPELPPAAEILHTEIVPLPPECRVSGGTAEYHGECSVHWFYRTEAQGADLPPAYASYHTRIPYSGSIPLEGAPDGCPVFAQAGIRDCETRLTQDAIGENRLIEQDFYLSVSVCAYENRPVFFPTDAYAERRKITFSRKTCKTQTCRTSVRASVSAEGTAECSDGKPCRIIDVFSDASFAECRAEDGKLQFTGTVAATVLYESENGLLCAAQSDVPFRYETDAKGIAGELFCHCTAAVSNTDAVILGDGVGLHFDLSLSAAVTEENTIETVGAIIPGEPIDGADGTGSGGKSVRIFYPYDGESLFEIGRRFHIPLDRLLGTNGLDPTAETVGPDTHFLLIPS